MPDKCPSCACILTPHGEYLVCHGADCPYPFMGKPDDLPSFPLGPYTTVGPVRGSCGHKHRSLVTASKCLTQDRHGCRSQGGYSDRTVKHLDGSPLTPYETALLG